MIGSMKLKHDWCWGSCRRAADSSHSCRHSQSELASVVLEIPRWPLSTQERRPRAKRRRSRSGELSLSLAAGR